MHLASITSQSGLLLWLVGLIVACIVVNAFAAMRAVRHVKLQPPNRILIEEGSPAREPWRLVNEGRKVARLITVEAMDRVWLSAAEIPPSGYAEAVPRDVFSRRGVYAVSNAWIVSLFPFGLVKAMRPVESAGEVLVFPKLDAMAAPEVRGLDPMIGGRHTGPGRIATGETFAGVRAAQPGDSFKQIHWKSSAKGGGLMVKTFEEELAGRAAILAFCAAESAAESCIRRAGSLALAGIEAGHQIEFYNLNEGRRVRTPPFGDTTRLLEELARFDPSPVQTAAKSFETALQTIPNRSALHLVATQIPPALEQKIATLLAEGKLLIIHLPDNAQTPTGLENATIRRFPVGVQK